MKAGFKVSVVAVNLNEENTIIDVLKNIPKEVDEVLVIDGNSTDKSPQIAKSLGYPVIAQKSKGRGNAFRLGFKRTSGDIIVMLSTDGNERPGDISKLLDKIIEGYDMVIASRFGQGNSLDVTLTRKFGNWFLTKLINIVAGINLQDSQNGFRAICRDALDKMNISAEKFDIEAEMSLKAGKLGLKIAEVPTTEDKREYGQSHLHTFKDGWRIFKRIVLEARRNPPYSV